MSPRTALAAALVALGFAALLLGRSGPRSGAPVAPATAAAPAVGAPVAELVALAPLRREVLRPPAATAPTVEEQHAGAHRDLAPGPTATVTLVGRVVAQGTNQPIGAVEVHLDRSAGHVSIERSGRGLYAVTARGGPRDAVTDEDGLFRLEVPATGSVWATCLGAGWSPREAVLRSGDAALTGGERPRVGESEVVVELERAARIEGRVVGAPAGTYARVTFRGGSLMGPEMHLEGRATMRALRVVAGDQFLQVAVQPDGELVLPDLPARVPLTVALVSPARREVSVLLQDPEPLTLEPGEVHRVDWSLADTGSIACTVRGPGGALAAGIELWLVTREQGRSRLHRQLVRPVATVTTDEAGRALFSGVRFGEWAVALAPGAVERVRSDDLTRHTSPCTLAVRNEVARVELELRR